MAPTTIRGRGRVASTSEERVWDSAEGNWLGMAEGGSRRRRWTGRCGGAAVLVVSCGLCISRGSSGSGVGVLGRRSRWLWCRRWGLVPCEGGGVVGAVRLPVNKLASGSSSSRRIKSSSRASCILSDKLKCTRTHLSLFLFPSSLAPSRHLTSILSFSLRHNHCPATPLLRGAYARLYLFPRQETDSIRPQSTLRADTVAVASVAVAVKAYTTTTWVLLDDQSCNHSRSHRCNGCGRVESCHTERREILHGTKAWRRRWAIESVALM
jgi:hypothetical protein